MGQARGGSIDYHQGLTERRLVGLVGLLHMPPESVSGKVPGDALGPAGAEEPLVPDARDERVLTHVPLLKNICMPKPC